MRFVISCGLLLAGCTAPPANAQSFLPPFCVGANRALQYGAQGWICTTITGTAGAAGPQGVAGPQGPQGVQGPAGTLPAAPPPPTECITSWWNGTQWACVPTNYLEAR